MYSLYKFILNNPSFSFIFSDLEAATLQANSWIYNIRSNYNEFCSKSTSPDEDPDNPPAGGSGPLPLERTVSIPPQMPMPSPVPVGPTKFPHPMAMPPQVKCDQSEVFPPAAARTHPMMMPLPPQPPPPLHNPSNNQAIRVEIPCKNGGNLNDFNNHVVVSDIALNINSILTPDHSSPESSGSQASIGNSIPCQYYALYHICSNLQPILQSLTEEGSWRSCIARWISICRCWRRTSSTIISATWREDRFSRRRARRYPTPTAHSRPPPLARTLILFVSFSSASEAPLATVTPNFLCGIVTPRMNHPPPSLLTIPFSDITPFR